MTGDPRVLAPLQQAFNASDIYHVKRYIGYAWEKETDTAVVVAPPLDERIRAWTAPPAEPPLEQRVAQLEAKHGALRAKLDKWVPASVTITENHEERIAALEQHPEPTAPDDYTPGQYKRARGCAPPINPAPDDPVCATCGGTGKLSYEYKFSRYGKGATSGDTPCPDCRSAPAAADLDPVRVEAALEAIVTQAYLYGSARYSQGVAVVQSRDVGAATDRMLAEWNKLESMIRTIGLGEAS